MKIGERKKIMIVAGEASGDMHAAWVIRALKRKAPTLRTFGLGGPLMAKAGMDVREDLTAHAIMGFAEVVRHLPLSLRRLSDCGRWLKEERPDLLLLVDYPGFNLRLAGWAHRLGIPVVHYIAPQVWAWHEGRIPRMKEVLTKLLTILPFEKAFFERHGMNAVHVGHPLMEEMDLRSVARAKVLKKGGIPSSAFPLVSAMPGSRKAEVERIWPLFLQASRSLGKIFPDATFLVPRPHGLEPSDYPGLTPDDPVFFVEAPAYDLRKACDLAWVKSGTGTLETALLGTPMVVAHKVPALTGYLAKRLLKIPYVSLVNILSDKEVVKELLQERATPGTLVEESLRLLDDPKARSAQTREFDKLRKALAHPAQASQNVAREIMDLLKK